MKIDLHEIYFIQRQKLITMSGLSDCLEQTNILMVKVVIKPIVRNQ